MTPDEQIIFINELQLINAMFEEHMTYLMEEKNDYYLI